MGSREIKLGFMFESVAHLLILDHFFKIFLSFNISLNYHSDWVSFLGAPNSFTFLIVRFLNNFSIFCLDLNNDTMAM